MASKTAIPPSIKTPISGRMGTLLRVPIDYILEVYTGGTITQIITLPQSPNNYTQTRPSATVITHTLGEVVREITQNHLTEISLSGVSGYAPRTGQTRDGGVSFLSGRAILEEFDHFLDEYQQTTSKNVDNVYMVFRALNEGQSFKVEPLEWRWSEDTVQNRFSYKWELKLEGYAHAPSSPLTSVFSPVTEAIAIAQQYINLTAGAVSLVSTALTNTRRELEPVRSVLRSITRVAVTLQGISSSIDGITSFFTRDIFATWANLVTQYKRAGDDFIELTGDDRNEYNLLTNYTTELFNYNVLVSAGITRVNKSDLERATNTPLIERNEYTLGTNATQQRFIVPFTVRAGDSLQRISQIVYGDHTKWAEIAEHNKMRDALHHAGGAPLRVGDVLDIPFDAQSETDLGLSRDGDILATDIQLNEDGDILLSDNDVYTVTGVQNLKQAITTRLLSEQGSSWIFPSYGLPVSIGANMSARTASFCASHVDQQLKADSRIRDVRDIHVLDDGDQLAVSVRVIPLNGETIDVITPFRS